LGVRHDKAAFSSRCKVPADRSANTQSLVADGADQVFLRSREQVMAGQEHGRGAPMPTIRRCPVETPVSAEQPPASFRSKNPAVTNVRFGSKADISQCNRHVPFTPESGPTNQCLLSANSGHRPNYSITSSARFCIDCGTVMPSVFAVLRLRSSSILLACWTGKSAGFSPLRTRPTYPPARR
jgi:hypothetical protein